MEHIVYLAQPEAISGDGVRFKYKMPQLPADRPNTMFIELLQLQLDLTHLAPYNDGLDVRLMTQASNYVSTDNQGVCLGLISFIREAGSNQDFAYVTNANPFKVLINSHQDYLEFNLYDIFNEVALGAISHCKMVLKITYPETPKQLSQEYRKQIPLPSRLI